MLRQAFILFFLLASNFLFAQDVLMQDGTVTQCSGTFYDSGGIGGNYSDNENFLLTICPDTPGEFARLDFTAFNLQLNVDQMTIFNGTDTTAPAFGTFSGNNSPGIITATTDNVSGCLTILFVSDASVNQAGWEATISCFEPCQTIVSQIDTTFPSPNVDGYIRVCPNEEITLTGSGVFSNDGTGATYEWDLGDGNTIAGQTAVFSYPNPGVYLVNLNIHDTNTDSDPNGCSNKNLINQVIQVSNEPDFAGTEAAVSNVCFGETTTISGVVNAVTFNNDCTPPVSGTTFLPDGNGVTYETSVTVDCFDSSQTLTDINQLVSICLTMEHSYLGDLDIDIVSPTGQTVRMLNNSGNSANLGIPWAVGQADSQSNNTTPGIGSLYCFLPDNSLPTLVGGVQTGGTFISGDGPGTYTDSYVPAGNYSSENSLNGLLGSSLNGDWTIRVTDNVGQDNGYIFSWSLDFDPSILPANLSFTPVITSEAWDNDPTITNTTGNVITVQPPAPGVYCYTYRVTNDFGCEYTEQVCIESIPEIIHDIPNNLSVCDTGAVDYEFDLSVNSNVISAPNPSPGDLVITYHESLNDAENDANEITNLTNYLGVDGQIIYVRVEYLSSGCYEMQTFALNVEDLALANQPSDLEECDVDMDGFAQFDLNSQTATILGAQLPTEFAVSYHLTQQDADNNVNALTSPYTSISSPQTIFARIENNADTQCFSTTSFQLIVNEIPTLGVIPDYEVCDDDSDGDDTNGLATFDLSTIDATAINGQTNVIVSYHISQADADANSNALNNIYGNINNFQNIFLRLENTITGCFNTTNFTLIVNELPTTTPVVELFQCDDDADGFVNFNLTEANELISDNYLNETFTYYTSQTDAQIGVNAIANPIAYTNTDPSAAPDILYVRTENSDGCFSVSQLNLLVSTTNVPQTFQLTYEVCDDTVIDGDDHNGIATFDFSNAETQIRNLFPVGQALTITYYETLDDALAEINAIPDISNHRNDASPFVQNIYVRIDSDLDNACLGLGHHITLTVNPVPEVVAVTDFIVCEDNTDGFFDFDLESKTSEVLNGQDPATFVVTYHETQGDADNNTAAFVSPYTNLTNPQQIFVRITNTVTGCSKSVVSFNLEVQEEVQANQNMPDYIICDEFGDNDGFAEFDLRSQDALVLDGQDPADYKVNYYLTLSDADLEINELDDNYQNITNPQTIYARVSDITIANSICWATTEINLQVDLLPIFDLDDEYLLCLDTNGSEVVEIPILDTQLPDAEYTFEWRLDGALLFTETSSSLTPSEGGTYTVLVTNNATGCQNTDSTLVNVSSPPTITAEVTSLMFANNHIVEVTATGLGIAVYEYSLDHGAWQDSNVFENVSLGVHIVTARDKNGCGLSSTSVIVIDYPLYFTPNGDGYNDTWNIAGIATQPNAVVYIFDRFGKLLKQLSPTGNGWNGTYNGEHLPTNDYWFSVEYNEPIDGKRKEFRAHFTLKR